MTALVAPDDPVRHRIRVTGVVQGVGFRPFVHRLATELALSGHVGNDSEGVFMEVEGRAPVVRRFELRVIEEAPPLARIFRVEATEIDPVGDQTFRIETSRSAGTTRTFVSPDIAVCDDCLKELVDPHDRRYRYPFINCTNCGPRFTITIRLPYDRPNTTMAGFSMCSECSHEYRDERDRRFHAQPIACATCGPRIWFETSYSESTGSSEPTATGVFGAPQLAHGTDGGTDVAIVMAQDALALGKIVAVKGIGGYHLACDATSAPAVETLRSRKNRMDKPFAVMVRDIGAARQLATIGPEEESLLTSPQRPVVLLRKRDRSPLAELVAPGSPYVGLLLAYTPLHHLLLCEVPGAASTVPFALVMTSGNLSDEPICFDDADARNRLSGIADAWLAHDRPIHVPCDDSVIRVDGGEVVPVRRSRGYAPLPVRLPFDALPVLATGGELKNTFCLASGSDAWMSQHIGDMGSLETLVAFERSTAQFGDMYQVDPAMLVADEHPGYEVRRWAEERRDDPVELVQHHHAHVAALMVEHGVKADERVIGCAFDGTGFGSDGAIWGGEILVCGYDRFERAAHLRYVALPGGDSSIRKPYRAALAHLWAAGIEWAPDLPPVQFAAAAERSVIRRQLDRGFQCVQSSSMGRLFDAVSSILGVRHTASYEAQAAIELETAAAGHLEDSPEYRFATGDGEIDQFPVLRSIVRDLSEGVPVGAIAAGFHVAVASMIGEHAEQLHGSTGIERIALTGGVFQNVLLLRLARAELARRGLTALAHSVVPPNDGGLALGQVAVACGRASKLAGR
jgi:hydrogenase maturation protein HypF